MNDIDDADGSPASLDWDGWRHALVRFAAATELCVCVYDQDLARQAGPLASSKVARLLVNSGVWNEDRRAEVAAAMEATGATFAPTTLATTVARLDAYTAELAAAATRACMHAEVEGADAPQVHEVTRVCLDERRTELDELVALLVVADAAIVRNAVEAVSGLSDIATCEDPSYQRRRSDTRESALATAEVRRQVARVHAMVATGATGEALKVAREAMDAAETSGDMVLRARARLLLGRVLYHVKIGRAHV